MTRFATIAILGLAAACGADTGERAATADSVQAGVPDGGLAANTPPGGLEDWVEEITTGTRDLAVRAATDGQGAQRAALDLYVGRQEYIEMYWGPTRALNPGEGSALGEAVLSAEQQFHDLLLALAVPPVDTLKVRAATDSLAARLARVVQIAKEAGVTLIPPGNPPRGGSQE